MRAPERSAWKVIHSLANPFKGGSAAMAADPTRKPVAVQGIRWISPPIASMFRVPVARRTAPDPRNRSPLKAAWFRQW